MKVRSYLNNPILSPEKKNKWEDLAVFNGCVIKDTDKYRLIYRAMGSDGSISQIGMATGKDMFNFSDRQLLIKPEEDWEKYGCEDPRVTKIGDIYFIFYTAISEKSPGADSIKVALAMTDDLSVIKEKHLVTPFNAKAMALFPKKIGGKWTAILTVDTDRPPAKIAIARFEKLEDIWSETFWIEWYKNIDKWTLPVSRISSDHVEVGAVPIETDTGWLLIYAHIQNYFSYRERVFGIEAILLDKEDPTKIIGRTTDPLMVPQEEYELRGMVPNIVFPSGALVDDQNLLVYYGAADNYCAVGMCDLAELTEELLANKERYYRLNRGEHNPILIPIEGHEWEARAVFNPAAVYLEGKVHLIYRSFSKDNTSYLGYANSEDMITISERLDYPVYIPRYEFELKKKVGSWSGCEDPRLTQIGERLYMCYTAYDGTAPPRIALTSILVSDFVNKRWNWEPAKVISDLYTDNKDGCLLPEKINDKFVFFHRSGGVGIVVDQFDPESNEVSHQVGSVCIFNNKTHWDSLKIGLNTPPIKTDDGWLMLYHSVSKLDKVYRLGAMLLDINDPTKVVASSRFPILEPEMDYEKYGLVNNVVFPCGAVVKDDQIYVYYGGGDKVIGVAYGNLEKLIKSLY